jgi:hypothetical protein
VETLESRCLLSGTGANRAALAGVGQIPLSFEANQGQTDALVRFLARGDGYALFLTDTEAVLSLQPTPVQPAKGPKTIHDAGQSTAANSVDDILRMQFVGANMQSQPTGLERTAQSSNYFLGNRPSSWRTDVPNFSKVEYAGLYPGIDLVFYGTQRELEYDFTVAPGADPGVIRMNFEGARKVSLDHTGNLILETGGTKVVEHAPMLYQENAGIRSPVQGRYVLEAGGQVGFEVGAYDKARPLVIDPVLSYLSYLGGIAEDEADDVALDTDGNIYVIGETQSTDFPKTTAGVLQGSNAGGAGGAESAGGDVFVLKLNPTGTAVLYATYIGGAGDDYGYTIAVDSAGNAYVGGETISNDFPTTVTLNPNQAGIAGYLDAFVLKLNAAGSALVYSSFLGGDGEDAVDAIAVDDMGQAYLAGFAGTNFPTTAGAFQPAFAGGPWDAFVAKVNAGGTALVYSTYLGGSGSGGELGLAMAIDQSGAAYVTGFVGSEDFPTTPGAFQPTFGGGAYDAFVTKLNSSGSGLVYSSYLGGGDDEDALPTGNYILGFAGIALDSSKNAYVTGFTKSTDFPTTSGTLQSSSGGQADAFVTKLSPSGSKLYSTYLGGASDDYGIAIAVDADGNAYTTGQTQSDDFPKLRVTQAALAGGTDAFVTKLNAAGSGLVYSTYLGGSGNDRAYSVAVDSSGSAYVVGKTASTDLQTAAPLQNASGGGADGFLAVITTPGALQFSAASYTVKENAGSAVITVVRTGSTAGSATVNYATSDGTALFGFDYTATSGSLSFAAGEATKTFSIPIIDDRTQESTETVHLSLSSPTGNAILGAVAQATLNIVDFEEGQFQFSASTYSVGEGAGNATITVTRTNGSDGSTTVHYATSDGSATAPGDYTSTSGNLSFAAGETTKSFTVAIVADSIAEGNETVNLTLSDPTGGAILGNPAQSVLTITESGTAPVAVDDTYDLGAARPATNSATSVLTNDTGSALTAVRVTDAASGTVTLHADGTFAYAPAASFWGIDSFTYKANNGALDSNVVIVTLMSHSALQVKKLYDQVLNRAPELSGWEYWTRRIDGGTASLGSIASEIFESPERIDPIVTTMYHDYLFRAPDAAGLLYWRGIWQRDGEPDNVTAGIVGSEEFYQSAGGTNRAWVTEMYRRLLHREPDLAGLDYWTGKLDSEQLDRFHVILGFVQSVENFHLLVRGWFNQYLSRNPSAQEEDLYFQQLVAGATQRTIQIELLDTNEYLNTPPAPPAGVAQRIG